MPLLEIQRPLEKRVYAFICILLVILFGNALLRCRRAVPEPSVSDAGGG